MGHVYVLNKPTLFEYIIFFLLSKILNEIH